MLNLIFIVLILVAALLSLLIIGSLFMWFKGSSSIAFPGLGLIVATPLVTILLIIIELIVIVIAVFVSSLRTPTLSSSGSLLKWKAICAPMAAEREQPMRMRHGAFLNKENVKC